MTVIDADNCIAGRLAAVVAKRLLKGEVIAIVNAEKAVITGPKKFLIAKFETRREAAPKGNPEYGPKYPRMPDKILRRVVRGMLPWKKSTGKNAYRKLKVYIGVPKEFSGIDAEKIGDAHNRHEKGFMMVEEISRALGADW
ncbi:MAG: 50S ribosomal protein L13 [archaeon]